MAWESCVPPGFRFHPTEEELVGYYLMRKINSLDIEFNVISEIDLYKMEPWDIEDRCKMGYEEQSEWYFFSHKDKKYPTGTRTNRATTAGFWKATGRDKAVVSGNKLIGMRKTLVFYSGRAPNGRKTDWIMHEYRLQSSEHAPPQDEGWVVCRAFKKPIPNQRQGYEGWNHVYYLREQSSNGHNLRPQSLLTSLIPDPGKLSHGQAGEASITHQSYVENGGTSQDHELFSSNGSFLDQHHHHHQQQLAAEVLPRLDSPLSTSLVTNNDALRCNNGGCIEDYYDDGGSNVNMESGSGSGSANQFIDWKNLDSFKVALEEATAQNNNINVSGNGSGYFLGFFPDS